MQFFFSILVAALSLPQFTAVAPPGGRERPAQRHDRATDRSPVVFHAQCRHRES